MHQHVGCKEGSGGRPPGIFLQLEALKLPLSPFLAQKQTRICSLTCVVTVVLYSTINRGYLPLGHHEGRHGYVVTAHMRRLDYAHA